MVGYGAVFLAAAALSATVSASGPACGPDLQCPDWSPCCSQYGKCGAGAYCLGGCDIRYSHSIDSCVPAPTCESKTYDLNTLDHVQSNDYYLGDASEAEWQVSGRPVLYDGGGLLLTMAPDTVGTLMASTHYVWYGKISARMATSKGAGVVTAFIMMSDVQDEIDFEFVGINTVDVQSNYYYHGYLDYTHSENLTVGDTYSTLHTYTIDWQPDSITWIVDGDPMRTLKRSDTWNDTANRYDFPQTPSRVMLSLWPAGLESNGAGTVEWAGGLVDWSSPYMTSGYYSALFKEVSVECYDPPDDATISGDQTYVYTDIASTEADVEITDDTTVLASFMASGEDPEYNPDAESATSTADSSHPSRTPETVPGLSGAGGRGDSGADEEDASSEGAVGLPGSNTDDAGTPLSTGASVAGGFQQHDDDLSAGTALMRESRIVGGSALAVVVAVLGLLVI